ncbi:MAG: DNA-processing protein DprA [Muribaculaceae bacterium]|nr:DNA-processing protein DprA [Muribaculaceae bacterium]
MTSVSAELLRRRIAFAGYRNVSLTNAQELELRDAGPEPFFSESASTLAARTGLSLEFFDDSARERAMEAASREADFIRANGVRALFWSDEDYPQRLAECTDAPAMLYALGHGDMNPRYSVGIVGTRHATACGTDFASQLVKDLHAALPDGLLIVSGLAYGIDIAAHEAALREGVATGAVLAHGLNTIYPAEHRTQAMRIVREGGFLLTEYTTGARTHRRNFLARNRIVAGMTDVLVVVESDMRGGAMATARLATAYGREVFAMPGRVTDPYSRGCNDLLVRGTARLIRDAGDLLEAMGWKSASRRDKSLPGQLEMDFEADDEKLELLKALRDHPQTPAHELCGVLDMAYGSLSAMLFELEMDDLVKGAPGGFFALTPAALSLLDSATR